MNHAIAPSSSKRAPIDQSIIFFLFLLAIMLLYLSSAKIKQFNHNGTFFMVKWDDFRQSFISLQVRKK
jgi:predicted membrane channel-forming protein YqfA (hemolysin III family)